MYGVSVDINNLRTETYTDANRIPDIVRRPFQLVNYAIYRLIYACLFPASRYTRGRRVSAGFHDQCHVLQYQHGPSRRLYQTSNIDRRASFILCSAGIRAVPSKLADIFAGCLQGLTDLLRDHLIRTPLDPRITFKDVRSAHLLFLLFNLLLFTRYWSNAVFRIPCV